MKIETKKPTDKDLEKRDVLSWPIWEKEISRFDWHYDSTEECYLLEGKVIVETKDGEKVEFGKGDHMMYYPNFKFVVSQYNHVNITHMSRICIKNYIFTGMNYVPDYPFANKDWCRRDHDVLVHIPQDEDDEPFTTKTGKIVDIPDLEEYFKNQPSIREELDMLPRPTDNTIYLLHAPPVHSGLDKCYKGPVGSVDIRNWIINNRPWLTLHGHIHESFELTGIDITEIGNTICINPGQKERGCGLRAAPKMFVWCEFNLNDVKGTYKRKEMREDD